METNGFENSLSSDLSQPEILSTEVIFQILKEVKLHRLFFCYERFWYTSQSLVYVSDNMEILRVDLK